MSIYFMNRKDLKNQKEKYINQNKSKNLIIEDGEKKSIDFFANLKGNKN